VKARKGLPRGASLSLPLSAAEGRSLAGSSRPFQVTLAGSASGRLGRRLAQAVQGLGLQLVVPLVHRGETWGLALLGARIDTAAFASEDLDILEHMGAMLASTLREDEVRRGLEKKVKALNHQTDHLRKIFVDTVHVLAGVLDGKAPGEGPGHSARVASLAAETGRHLGLSPMRCERLYLAGLLHDIGKQMIDRDILGKNSALDDTEREIVHRHPEIAYELLSHIDFPWGDVAAIIRHHHERPDGRGYPHGLNQSAISLEAKVLILAEAFDAMLSDQPWRKRLAFPKVVEELSDSMGLQFEPEVVSGLCAALEDALQGKSEYSDFVPTFATSAKPELIEKMLRVLRSEVESRRVPHPARIIEIKPDPE
jgi:putative nucleotidyltransferase with HDIG domain